MTPESGLVVLSAPDWVHYVAIPIFGITHYDYPRQMAVTAGQRSTFWRTAIDLIGNVAPQLLHDLHRGYATRNDDLDLTPHIDLWLPHDLGHACHLQHAYWFPRRWLMKYFADLCAYTYTAMYEPTQLPALETFPRVMFAIDKHHVTYATLHDFDAQYLGGDMQVENYLWYHGAWYEAARQEYHTTGQEAVQRMWGTFVGANIQDMTDDDLLHSLQHIQPQL